MLVFSVYCEAGSESVTSGVCMPCGVGTYKETPGVQLCDTCGLGLTTLESGATSHALCQRMYTMTII